MKVISILAVFVVLFAFGGEAWVMAHPVPEGSQMLIGRVLGTLDSSLVMVLSYYFGSSAGSDTKTSLLAQASAVPPPPGAGG